MVHTEKKLLDMKFLKLYLWKINCSWCCMQSLCPNCLKTFVNEGQSPPVTKLLWQGQAKLIHILLKDVSKSTPNLWLDVEKPTLRGLLLIQVMGQNIHSTDLLWFSRLSLYKIVSFAFFLVMKQCSYKPAFVQAKHFFLSTHSAIDCV